MDPSCDGLKGIELVFPQTEVRHSLNYVGWKQLKEVAADLKFFYTPQSPVPSLLQPYVFGNAETGKPFTDIKRSFHTACRMARIEGRWRHDLRATFCTRLALAGYEALTIMSLMGHKDLKTTMRYIRAVQLQRQVRSQNFVHKLATQ